MQYVDIARLRPREGSTSGSITSASMDVSADGDSGQRELEEHSHNHPTRGHTPHLRLGECERLVIFNTKRYSVPEVWSELRAVLDEALFAAIFKLQKVTHLNRHPRIDMWVLREAAASLVRVLHTMTRERDHTFVEVLKEAGFTPNTARLTVVSGWRVALWRPWRDRHAIVSPMEPTNDQSRKVNNNIATLNVNGFAKKAEQVLDFVNTENVAVLALQETLVSDRSYPVRIEGYNTYAVPWQEGFRGHALLIDDRLPSYEIPHAAIEGNRCLLHVKVSGLRNLGRPAHCVGVYLPSGGNYAALRTALVRSIFGLCNDILKREPGALVVFLGDFNMDGKSLDNRCRRKAAMLSRLQPVGASQTRFPVRGRGRDIDHLMVSPGMAAVLRPPRVMRDYCMSDHRPLVSQIRLTTEDLFETPRRTSRIDNKALIVNAEKLVHHNKWTALLDLEDDTPNQLSELAEGFSRANDFVSRSLGVRKWSVGQKPKFPRKVKGLLKRHKELARQVATEHLNSGKANEETLKLWRDAKAKLREGLKGLRRRQRQKLYAQIADDYNEHDSKNMWSRLRSQVHSTHRGEGLQPVRNKRDELRVDANGILEATAEHYRALAQDDPDRLSRDEHHWEGIDAGVEQPELPGINDDLEWPVVLIAIREMNRNTSPGLDGSHVNELKCLVAEECMAELKVQNPDWVRPDNVRVDLDKDHLPKSPLTPMGKALFKVLVAVWKLEVTPDQWDHVIICNLFKQGNPELLTNYRGISLISVALKVLLGIMVIRLTEAVEGAGLIAPEQSGFRKREEAVAQFLVLAEIVRRRHLAGLTTVGIFVDFKKAYDKVHHGALYRILASMGVRGKFLEFLKHMYSHSKMSVRTGGLFSEYFDMFRGTRQGCPLSPLLFIIFINRILLDCSCGGVSVPGLLEYSWILEENENPTNVPDVLRGGKFADDLICLESTVQAGLEVARKLDDWAVKWGQELGFGKCGAICWTSDELVRALHNEVEYVTPSGTIPKVDSYKYLGIEVTAALTDSRKDQTGFTSDEYSFSKRQAAKGFKALSQMKPLLLDRLCPVPLKVACLRTLVMPVMVYGSEWTAFKQVHAQPMQRVIDVGVRWIMGVAGNDYTVASATMSFELGLPSVEEVMASMRARLHAKLKFGDPPMKTWLQALASRPYFPPGGHRKLTWVTLNERWLSALWAFSYEEEDKGGLKKYKDYDPDDDATVLWRHDYTGYAPLRPWAARCRMYELHAKSNSYASPYLVSLREWLGGIDSLGRFEDREGILSDGGIIPLDGPDLALERYLQQRDIVYKNKTRPEGTLIRDVEDCVLERRMTADRTLAFRFYDAWCFGATRGFVLSSMSRPDLCDGVRWLMAVRTKGFPTVEKAWYRLTFSGRVPPFDKELCPLCLSEISPGFEWAHLLVGCCHQVALDARQKHLHDPLIIAARLAKVLCQGPTVRPGAVVFDKISGLSSQTNGSPTSGRIPGVTAIYLVGGVVESVFDCTYHLGFGQTDMLCVGLKSFGYVYVASFFQEVAPLYAKALQLDAYGEAAGADEVPVL